MELEEHAALNPVPNGASEYGKEPRVAATDASKFHKMEALGLFADGIARALNNILSQIIGFCDLALDDAQEGSVQEDNLRLALDAADRAKQLARRIQVIGGKSLSPKRNVLLHPLMEQTLGLLETVLPVGVAVGTDFQPDTRAVLADSAEIQEVLWNLAVNACDAMKGRGTLTLRLYEKEVEASFSGLMGAVLPGNFSIIEVTDTGCGMDDASRAQAFEPFFTTKEPGKGVGMGLSVVFGIIQSHGGNLVVESTPGEGTTFRVFLPKSDASAEEVRGSYFSETPILGTERILFVDDDVSVTEVAERLLCGLGYTVVKASTGKEALLLLGNAEEPLDLVLCDQTLKDIGGFDLSKEIHARHPEVPVIMCTGHLSELSTETAETIGIARYLMKPLTRKELAQTVREVLDKK